MHSFEFNQAKTRWEYRVDDKVIFTTESVTEEDARFWTQRAAELRAREGHPVSVTGRHE